MCHFFETKLKKTFRFLKFFTKLLLGREVFYFRQKKIPTELIGTKEYGSWLIHPKNVTKDSIVYSFGIGQDISFDTDLIKKFDCKVFAFDPTPKSISWLKKQTLPKNLRYFEIGLNAKDDIIEMFPPQNPHHVSYSIVSKNSNAIPVQIKVAQLKTIMQDLGHLKIDILKMDIEGSEYRAIDNILKSNINIDQILVEFHHRFPKISPRETKKTIEQLNNADYKIFAISSSREEYSFVKSK